LIGFAINTADGGNAGREIHHGHCKARQSAYGILDTETIAAHRQSSRRWSRIESLFAQNAGLKPIGQDDSRIQYYRPCFHDTTMKANQTHLVQAYRVFSFREYQCVGNRLLSLFVCSMRHSQVSEADS